MKYRQNPLLRSASLAAVVAFAAASSAQAQTTRTWDGGGVGGTNLSTPANWSSNTLPVSGDTAQWNGTVAGNLVLDYTAAFVNANNGVSIDITSAQTGSLTIATSNGSSMAVQNITIANGAGAFTYGDNAGVQDSFGFRGASNLLTNNDNDTATIAAGVGIFNGGAAIRTVTFAGSGNWAVNSALPGTGTFSVTKDGSGTLTLSASNGHTGLTTVSNGILKVGHANALGTNGSFTTRTVISNGATLELATNTSVAAEWLDLGSSVNGTVVVNRATSDVGITHSLGTLYLGSGATLNAISGSNVTGGTARLSLASLIMAGGSIGNATFNPTSAAVSITGSVSSGVAFDKTLVLDGTNANNAVSGIISDGSATVSLTKSGASTWELSNANTYGGLTTVSGGLLNITSTGSLKSGNALTVGASGTANFANASQTLGAVINENTTANALNFSAATGTVTLASLTGAGNTRFGSAGTVTGGISTGTVNAVGLLTASISGGTVGAGSLSSTAVSGGATTVSGVATIGTLSAGTANLNGATSAITTLNGGTVNMGSSTVLTVSDGMTSGTIAGSGGSLTKSGSGTLTLSSGGTYSYTGATSVSAGKLIVNGNISTSTTTVSNTGTFGGSGTASAVTLQTGGKLAPGNSIGTLTAQGNVNFQTNSIFEVEIDTAASYDSLGINSAGTLSIASGAKLELINFGSANLITLNSRLQLIDYTGGTWNGGFFTFGTEELADSETFAWQDNTWRINYNDTLGAGNTSLSNGGSFVTLTAIPEPSTLLLGGLSLLTLLRRRA